MRRYGKYFLEHLIYLQDDFCKYYVQDPMWCRQDILDAPCLVFFLRPEAERWLRQCVRYDGDYSMHRLRRYLAYDCPDYDRVHKMDDRQVVGAVARELTMCVHRVVIEPKCGDAVVLSKETGEAEFPVRFEAAPSLNQLLCELKSHLDALVAEQQRKYDRYETELAAMSPEQKAAAFGGRAGKGLIGNAATDTLDTLKALPGLYTVGLKKAWSLLTLPSRLTWAALGALRHGHIQPLSDKISAAVRPLTRTREQALEITAMLLVLFSDDETYELLYDFAGRYWAATHPLEKTEIAAGAFSDIAMAIILALVTAGIGTAANILTKSRRLEKAAELLKKIHHLLKRTGRRHRLGQKHLDTGTAKSAKAARKARTRGMPEIEPPPKKPGHVDDALQKEYGGHKERHAPKSPVKNYTHTKVGGKSAITDGNYTTDPIGMARHKPGTAPNNKSVFKSGVDAEQATLDAARYADKNNLWNAQNKAKVPVNNADVGYLSDGTPTQTINVYRRKSGGGYLIHGTPGSN